MATKFNTVFSHGKVEPFKCVTPSKTEQQFEYETNINNLVNGCVNTSLPANTSQAMYGLTITGDEYQKALDASSEVMNYFEQLPSKAKEYFHYRPTEMLEFIKDDSNYKKAYELGLISEERYYACKDAFELKQAELLKDNAPVVTPDSSGVTSDS